MSNINCLKDRQNEELPPADMAPMVSPWYPPSKPMNRLRCDCPQLIQYWWHILIATSTEVEPLSEKNTRVNRPGNTSRSEAASCSAGSWVKPAKITCSSFFACSAIADAMRGSPWPCNVTHQLEMQSMSWRPSSSHSDAPCPCVT